MEGEVCNDPSPSPSPSPSSSSSSPQLLTVKIGHGLRLHEMTVPADTTFGDLKTRLAPLTGVYPHEQRILCKGKEKEDSELLHAAGIHNNSKLLLIENAQSRERRLQETREKERITKACQAVAHVREEVDKLSAQVSSLEARVENGNMVAENTFAMLSEMLMQQLLKLDGIEAEGEAKLQRKTEVQFVHFLFQFYVYQLAIRLIKWLEDIDIIVESKCI
ncbi:hypothetical protein GOP47_0024612 [Adiantum capillus-veneris]|uniref:Uncharacterized protein n=1 Tax=Adiantum capillus-veneris TaxID=13818 RepID=A0A9D4U2Z3_ADICA|nr:hypothetical protein GOP47_0024612 [Adiantum capillus-veneris]